LPIDDVLCLVVQLLVALQCAHEQGVWHRDIKPANLMVTPEGRLKITDFGIARIDDNIAALPRERGVMGSPGYLAPECYANGAQQGDQRADVYACGVLLFELLTGLRPFRGSPDVVMYKTLHLPVPPLAAPGDAQFVPLSRFAHVVQRALAKSPDDRFASALEMRTALTLAAERDVPHALSAPAMRMLSPAPARAAAAAVPRTPAAPPVASTAAAAPSAPQPFADSLLARVAAELHDDLGPMAECVVRCAAAHGDASVSGLLMRVANDALPASRRAGFVERLRVLLADRRGPATHPPTGAVVPVLSEVLDESPPAAPIDSRLLQDAEHVLTPHVGPMAALLVRRAAAGAATRDQFITRLAGMAAEGQEREALFTALRGLC
jgi:eukaryotic-like serine/threonine-protein kinase